MRTFVTALVFSLSLLCLPQTAEARAATEFRYPYEQLWGATIRLLRVDHGFPIRDRDEGSGFILFDYQERGNEASGSVELIRVNDGSGVRITIQVPSLPSYVSRMLLDRLTRKLRADFGDQPSNRRRAPVADSDSNTEADDDETDSSDDDES